MRKKTKKIIYYSDIENSKKDDSWNIFSGEVMLEKKEIIPKKNSKVLSWFPELKLRKKQKIALVLGGGGAKGLAHVGIIRELLKYDVDIRLIVGTSIGAIVGALLALEGNLDLIDNFLQLKRKDIISFKEFSFSLKGLIKGTNMENILRGLFGNATFADTKIPLILNAVDIETGKEVAISKGRIFDAVRASIAIPIVFKPKKINGKIFVDGGVKNNVAYNLVPKSFKKVVVSNLTWQIPKANNIKNGIHYLFHIISLLHNNSTHIPDDKRIIHVKPDVLKFSIFDFGKIKEIIAIGEQTGKNIFPRHFKRAK